MRRHGGTRYAWIGTIGLVLAVLLAAPVMAQDADQLQTDSEEVAFEPVTHLMGMIASAEDADRETVADALEAFMGGLLDYLADQGVSEVGLDEIESNFERALDAFLQGQSSASAFGTEIEILARQLQTEAQLSGIDGVPSALLEATGVPPETVEKLADGEPPSPDEAAEIAQSVAAENQGPPDDAGPPEDPGNGEEDEDEAGDEDDDGPPENPGPPNDDEDEDEDGDGEGPPENPGPPDDNGEDDEDDNGEDNGGGPPGN